MPRQLLKTNKAHRHIHTNTHTHTHTHIHPSSHAKQYFDSATPRQSLLTQRCVEVSRCGVEGETHHRCLPQKRRIIGHMCAILSVHQASDNGARDQCLLCTNPLKHKFTNIYAGHYIHGKLSDPFSRINAYPSRTCSLPSLWGLRQPLNHSNATGVYKCNMSRQK